jgi:hypothetical protein
MKKQTAVEYTIQEIEKLAGIKISRDENCIQQAKEIFEQQIIDANDRGWKVRMYGIDETAEQYYREQFNNEEL